MSVQTERKEWTGTVSPSLDEPWVSYGESEVCNKVAVQKRMLPLLSAHTHSLCIHSGHISTLNGIGKKEMSE